MIEVIAIRAQENRGRTDTTRARGDKKLPDKDSSLEFEAEYDLAAANRDIQKEIKIDAKNKVLEFVFDDENETTWICDGATLHELYPEAENLKRGNEPFLIPATIKNTNAERGIFGEIAAKLLRVYTKKAVESGVANLARKMEDKHLTDKDNPAKSREGLNYLSRSFEFTPFDSHGSDKPFFLFIHGTNSDTKGAFIDLNGNDNADVWNFIHDTYQKNVLAFEHRTLTQSPLQNALDLVQKLPNGSVLHVISHSRGGLVGDILCRYSSEGAANPIGFSNAHIQLLAKEPNRKTDISCIKKLNEIFSTKKITVKKFIRVASPAAGTRLASSRMDQILNVLYNVLGADASNVAPILKELIAEVLKTKQDSTVLPGIEAMGPESPFIKILNDRAAETAVSGTALAVIAGNGMLSVSFRGLLVILGKLFYGQRNDLVVNTDSMYLGANRKKNIQYFFDEGKNVDHVSYFKNSKTRLAIIYALKATDGESIPGYNNVAQYQVPASDRGMVRGFEHGELFPYPNIPTGKKPILILLPGIMGSNLSRKKNKIWLAYLRAVFGGLYDMEFNADTSITASSLIKSSYQRLADRLSQTYDVVVYPFDWRKQLNDCAKDFEVTIIHLLKLNQPIKIVGHSMGGVLVRDFIINHDETWQKLNASKGFLLLFLGSPLGGSFRIPAVLFGSDPIISSLNMLDRVHTKKELVQMFVNFPGILSLLPLSVGKNDRQESVDFADANTWKAMREVNGDSSWPIPSAESLATFKAYRDNINAKKEKIDYSNAVYIAGKDKATVCDYYLDSIPPRTELVFLSTGEGDQSVTWETGIPKKMIAGNHVYYTDTTHGALANDPNIFGAIEDILDKGATVLLKNVPPAVRGEEKVFRSPTVFNFDLSERGLENAVLGITETNEQLVNQVPLSVSVSHGDLAYASFPVLAGHFTNDGILYAEKSIDYLMNKSLSARHALGIYPGDIGTSAAMTTSIDDSDFPGALVVGLGEPGTLTVYLLTQTVEQAVSKYLLDMNNQTDNGKEIGISALIVGCGYGGLTVEGSIKAIIEGINNANSKLSELYVSYNKSIRLVQYIEFIELYEDRAINCMYALRKIESKENRQFNIRIGNKGLKTLFGSRRQLAIDTSEEWWRRITIRHKLLSKGSKEMPALVFGSSTGDAREEEKELYSSTALIDLFIEQISTQDSWSPCAAKTLFELMIPNEFKDRLKKKGSINWILEKETAAYPWELLLDKSNNAKPLCVNAGMIRQLSTKDFRMNIKRVAGDKALVIADPELDGFVSQLSGAKREGELVTKLLQANGYERTSLINKTTAEIVQGLFCDEFKIVHLAGHGFYNPDEPARSGMVIGKDIFLTAFDIEQMNTVPELVFINCCHLGKIDADHEKYYANKYKLAANLGTQLIQMGVKAVIAAGWAVNDAAALDFANEFYAKMFAGSNFGDAVKDARSQVYEKYHNNNNTWGAYQCYGDPFYKLVNRSSGSTASALQYVMPEEVMIDLGNLQNGVDTKNYTCTVIIDKIKNIKEAVSQAGISEPGIAEIEALIYYELGEYDMSVNAFDQLRKGEKAAFSVASLEKFCNARCKKYVEDWFAGGDAPLLIQNMEDVIDELMQLMSIQKTGERHILVGSAYKRIGLLSKTKIKKLKAYKDSIAAYGKAYENNGSSYAFRNLLLLERVYALVSGSASRKLKTASVKTAADIKELKNQQTKLNPQYRNMDYWELIEAASIDFLLLLLEDGQNKAGNKEDWALLQQKYERIWKKAGSKGKVKAELENFAIIADGLGNSSDKHALYLQARVIELKDNLKKHVIA